MLVLKTRQRARSRSPLGMGSTSKRRRMSANRERRRCASLIEDVYQPDCSVGSSSRSTRSTSRAPAHVGQRRSKRSRPAPAADRSDSGTTRRRLVEILYFDGCPNHERRRARRTGRPRASKPTLKQAGKRPRQRTAQRLASSVTADNPRRRLRRRPHAEQRTDYRSPAVFSDRAWSAGQPDERWVRDASRTRSPEPMHRAHPRGCAIPRSLRHERTSRLSHESALYTGFIERFAQASGQPWRSSPNGA